MSNWSAKRMIKCAKIWIASVVDHSKRVLSMQPSLVRPRWMGASSIAVRLAVNTLTTDKIATDVIVMSVVTATEAVIAMTAIGTGVVTVTVTAMIVVATVIIMIDIEVAEDIPTMLIIIIAIMSTTNNNNQ